MNLSRLISYIDNINQVVDSQEIYDLKKHFEQVLYVVRHHEISLPDFTLELEDKMTNVNDSVQDYIVTLSKFKQEINAMIAGLAPSYLARSYQLYDTQISHDTPEYILTRGAMAKQYDMEYMKYRVIKYADWHYPAMVLRPGREPFVEDLVACDPLYLVDTDHQLLEPALSRFSGVYLNRLRQYIVKESMDKPIFDKLPDEQFGFCLVYYFFNFKPLELIKIYLKELYTKLKPGGTLCMTYNDCDRAGGVILFERNFMCYTPGELVLGMARSIGFEVRHLYHLDASCAWVELTKPGSSESLRGGQSLARIVVKSK